MAGIIEELEEALASQKGSPEMIFYLAVEIGMEAVKGRITHNSAESFDNSLRTELLNFLDSLRTIFEIKVPWPEDDGNIARMLDSLHVHSRSYKSSQVAKRLRQNIQLLPEDRHLSNNNRSRIAALSTKLRRQILDIDPSEKIKPRLLEKLDDFDATLAGDTNNVGKVLTALALVGAGVASTTSFLADAPAAAATIAEMTSLVGRDAQSEADQKLLETEEAPLGLPAPAEIENGSSEI